MRAANTEDENSAQVKASQRAYDAAIYGELINL